MENRTPCNSHEEEYEFHLRSYYYVRILIISFRYYWRRK